VSTVSTPVSPVNQQSHRSHNHLTPVVTTWLHTWQDF